MFAKPKSSVFIDTVVFEVESNAPSCPLRAILRDEKGCIMSTMSAELPKGRTHYRWNGLSNLPYGVYQLEMQHGEEETSMRMVKRI